MQSIFSRKFNEITADKFGYIKLTDVNVNLKEQSIELCLIYPSDKKSEVESNEKEIKQAVAATVKTEALLVVNLKAVCFDLEYCRQILKDFFKKYPSVFPYVNIKETVCAEKTEADSVFLEIPVNADIIDYCKERDLSNMAVEYLEMFFTEKIHIAFLPRKDGLSDNDVLTMDNDEPVYRLSMDGGRNIIPGGIKEIIGKSVEEPAMYIEDCSSAFAEETVVLCGTVSDFKELKKSDGSKTFYKFTLTDFTASMDCLIFPNKTATAEKISQICDGMEIVLKGQLKEKEFRGEKTLSVFVRSVSGCVLPADFVKNEIYRTTPDSYKTVFPEPYLEETQMGLFEEKKDNAVPEYVKGKTYVVYDFETTGLDTRVCKIIEIGAVKIVDGKFTETFSTLIDPGEKLEDRIVETTNITDEMLFGKPAIEDVLPDFNLFCDKAVLVGQNSNDFDYKILQRVASEQKLRFSAEHEDTMVMAKKLLRRVHNYKLATLAKYYGVVNENAHRALDDAVTTAKVFLNLAKML